MADRTIRIHLLSIDEENDGASFLRRGPQRTTEVMTVENAIKTYGAAKVIKCLHETADRIEAMEFVRTETVKNGLKLETKS